MLPPSTTHICYYKQHNNSNTRDRKKFVGHPTKLDEIFVLFLGFYLILLCFLCVNAYIVYVSSFIYLIVFFCLCCFDFKRFLLISLISSPFLCWSILLLCSTFVLDIKLILANNLLQTKKCACMDLIILSNWSQHVL